MNMSLSKRLAAAVAYVREGSVLSDVGTDHAYLPIYAVENGLAKRAIASDINDGPLKNAESNIKKHGLSDKISCVLTSGFDGLDSFGITDAVIAGMGGELIADIVNAADFIKTDGFRLVVQPMTMLDTARSALFRLGFSILNEYVLKEDGKFYTVISAEYTGISSEENDVFTLTYGEPSKRDYESDEVRSEFYRREAGKYERIIAGKRSAGICVCEEETILKKLTERAMKNDKS